jgi:hypothetical protein
MNEGMNKGMNEQVSKQRKLENSATAVPRKRDQKARPKVQRDQQPLMTSPSGRTNQSSPVMPSVSIVAQPCDSRLRHKREGLDWTPSNTGKALEEVESWRDGVRIETLRKLE